MAAAPEDCSEIRFRVGGRQHCVAMTESEPPRFRTLILGIRTDASRSEAVTTMSLSTSYYLSLLHYLFNTISDLCYEFYFRVILFSVL